MIHMEINTCSVKNYFARKNKFKRASGAMKNAGVSPSCGAWILRSGLGATWVPLPLRYWLLFKPKAELESLHLSKAICLEVHRVRRILFGF